MDSLLRFLNILFIIQFTLISGFFGGEYRPNYMAKFNGTIANGLVFPNKINAVVGEEVYLKNVKPVINQTKCLYHKTGGKDENVQSPHKDNLEQWHSEICGLYIKNITMADQGIWRLTSMNENNVIARGISIIKVRDEIPHRRKLNFKPSDIIELPEKPAYCYVTRPKESKTTFPQHEKCDFPQSENDLDALGKWNVMYGAKGKTREVSFDLNVEANVEEIQTSSEHDKQMSTLNMKCTLLNSKRTLKFCRFLRLDDNLGFNLEEGRGDEQYRYFGHGFANHECGISIEKPSAIDKSMWKCFMGLEQDDDAATVGAIISGVDTTESEDDIESDDVYGLQHTAVNLLCKRKSPIDYCWFRDPSGNKISISDRTLPVETDAYRYFGGGFKLGECGLTIRMASHNDTGTWSCHMGTAQKADVDRVREISVRIAESSLVSMFLLQDAEAGTSLSVECRSIPEHLPLDYCRFVDPNGVGFSIDEGTTKNNPHLDNYHFNPNRQLKSGYCSLIIKTVDQSHNGQWTCAARLTGDNKESWDEFRVTVFRNNISGAGISAIAVAFACIFGIIFTLSYKAYRQHSALAAERRTTNQSRVTYITGTDQISISSNHSDNILLELQQITN